MKPKTEKQNKKKTLLSRGKENIHVLQQTLVAKTCFWPMLTYLQLGVVYWSTHPLFLNSQMLHHSFLVNHRRIWLDKVLCSATVT